MMIRDVNTDRVREIMLDFAERTGLEPAQPHPKRYLWTDAFAVCNYLELFRRTNDRAYRDLAVRLIDQVHQVLGRHRDDDQRKGWISGLDNDRGEQHPTQGGLRIGKPLPEGSSGNSFDDPLEWERDGQYFHYLTRWMHALSCTSRITGDEKYHGWAVELAQAAHARFTYVPRAGTARRMYWKMSIDLSRPLVPSMGQHDPLDGFVTYHELQADAVHMGEKAKSHILEREIADMAGICRGTIVPTNDPLGTGGLLWNAAWTAQLMVNDNLHVGNLLESVLDSALIGVTLFVNDDTLSLPAEYRLAFREIGLSLGLRGIHDLPLWLSKDPELTVRRGLMKKAETLAGFQHLADVIEQFWNDPKNRNASTWAEHRDINEVMLATSLAPGSFISFE